MDSRLLYYIFCILAVVVGIVVVKKMAGCLIKGLVLFAVVVAMALIYFYYFK